jgi:low affinity Fe/Cu permease
VSAAGEPSDQDIPTTSVTASRPPRSSGLLHRLGDGTSNPVAGAVAGVAALCWVAVGTVTEFPTWWQVILYSTTAIVTFVMVFVIQHTQSKQVAALQRKLDELIRTSQEADNSLISVEQAPEVELQQLANQYRDQRHEAIGD